MPPSSTLAERPRAGWRAIAVAVGMMAAGLAAAPALAEEPAKAPPPPAAPTAPATLAALIVVRSPDTLGLMGAQLGELGFRYRWATGDRWPELP